MGASCSITKSGDSDLNADDVVEMVLKGAATDESSWSQIKALYR